MNKTIVSLGNDFVVEPDKESLDKSNNGNLLWKYKDAIKENDKRLSEILWKSKKDKDSQK